MPADSDPTPTPSADTFSAENSAPAGTEPSEDAPAVKGLPQEEKPLAKILGTGEDGSPKMYTTLYDDQNRVISTNDPTLEQGPFYLGGGTLDLGAAVYVRFRMAEILPQHEGGVQKNVPYYMENLPQELVPAETDSEGNEILNPEEPVEFFQLGGSITAHGGIYGSPEEGYRLKMHFEGLEEQIDISGAFQYGSNVSETLTPGATYWITYVPGGSVSFTVTPTVPEPQEEGYTLSTGASSGGLTSFYWWANINKIAPAEGDSTTEGDPNATFPYRKLTITTPDAMGVWINETDGDIPGFLNAYGDKTGPGLRLVVTYTAKDAEDKKLTDSLVVDSSNCNLIRNDNGVTIIRITGVNGSPNSDSYSCTAELVMQNGDISRYVGSNGNTLPSSSRGSMQQYPIKIQATGHVPVPGLAKTGVAAEINNNSDMQWTLTPQKVNVPYGSVNSQTLFTGNYFGYGGYNGTLTISDSMAASSITDSNDTVIQGLNPGRYTHVPQMFTGGVGVSEYGNGSGTGPLYVGPEIGGGTYGNWEKYQNGNWISSNGKKIWDPENLGIYCTILTEGGNGKQNPLAVYVFYAGNMADSVRNTLGSQLASGAEPIVANINDATYSKSLVVEYRGLNQALYSSSSISPIVYTTKTDEQALLAAANNATAKSDSQQLAAYYDLSLKNSAGLSMWNIAGSSPSTTTVMKRISAELSIEKTAEPVNTGNYSLKVTNGLTSTSKITMEDYLTGFANVERKLNTDGSPTPTATGACGTPNRGHEQPRFVVRDAASVRRYPDGSGGTEEEVEQITDHSPTF